MLGGLSGFPLADNSPDHEDQNLVVRARSGDRTALEHLVQRHQAWIYNIAVRPRQVAECDERHCTTIVPTIFG